MSIEIKTDKVRPISAFPGSAAGIRTRPLSGGRGPVYSRQDLIHTTYNGMHTALPNRSSSAKSLVVRQQLTANLNDKPKKVVKKNLKAREDMAEQIINLKLTINGLKEGLAHQRGKTEEIRKKYNKFARVLNVKFETERMWNADIVSSHKVEGMRSMYDRLKEQYEALQQEHQQLAQSSRVTHELEYIKYIEALEMELGSLYDRFERISENSQSVLAGLEGEDQMRARMHLLGQGEMQYNSLLERYTKLKAKYQMTNENLKDRNKRITFLENYAKDLENKIKDLQKKKSYSEKESRRLEAMLTVTLREEESYKRDAERQIQQLKRELQTGLLGFEREKADILAQKDHRIAVILKQNNYYQEMIQELRQTNTQVSRECQKLKQNKNFDRAFGSDGTYTQEETRYDKEKLRLNFVEERERTVSDYASRKSVGEPIIINGKRMRQTADKRYREHAIKKRKVDHSDILEVIELVRLRMIGQSITVQTIFDLITFKTDVKLSLADLAWHQQHISLKEMKHILQKAPFSLLHEQAELLSRYLIEDVQQEHVFVDEQNQNYRNIVKSIFKTILGNYPILQENQELKVQLKEFLDRYGANVNAILKGVEPSGFVSKKRFLDVLRGAGATECSQWLIDALLSRMVLKASSLTSMNYPALFENNRQ